MDAAVISTSALATTVSTVAPSAAASAATPGMILVALLTSKAFLIAGAAIALVALLMFLSRRGGSQAPAADPVPQQEPENIQLSSGSWWCGRLDPEGRPDGGGQLSMMGDNGDITQVIDCTITGGVFYGEVTVTRLANEAKPETTYRGLATRYGRYHTIDAVGGPRHGRLSVCHEIETSQQGTGSQATDAAPSKGIMTRRETITAVWKDDCVCRDERAEVRWGDDALFKGKVTTCEVTKEYGLQVSGEGTIQYKIGSNSKKMSEPKQIKLSDFSCSEADLAASQGARGEL